MELYERIRLQNLFEFLDPSFTDILLDAGCGGGVYTKHLAEVSTVIAADISKKALGNAKSDLSKFSKRIHFVLCDIEYLPIRGKSVDKIASIDALEHIPSVEAFLGEAARISKSNGRILIITACGKNKLTLEHMLQPFLGKLINSIRLKFGHISIFNTEQLCNLLEPNFQIIRIQYMHHWFGWSLIFLWNLSSLNLTEDCSKLPAFKNPFMSALTQMLWLVLAWEHKLLKNASSGSEICISARKKR